MIRSTKENIPNPPNSTSYSRALSDPSLPKFRASNSLWLSAMLSLHLELNLNLHALKIQKLCNQKFWTWVSLICAEDHSWLRSDNQLARAKIPSGIVLDIGNTTRVWASKHICKGRNVEASFLLEYYRTHNWQEWLESNGVKRKVLEVRPWQNFAKGGWEACLPRPKGWPGT